MTIHCISEGKQLLLDNADLFQSINETELLVFTAGYLLIHVLFLEQFQQSRGLWSVFKGIAIRV